jgi:NTE family protein
MEGAMGLFNKKKLKTGLALGSGAARGLAHIGVLHALKEKNISIDMVAGSSMGALVGACYARNGEITDFEEIVLKMDWKRLALLADPNLALFFKGVIHGKKVKALLKTIIGDSLFKDLKVPLAVVTTDVNTGEEVVIKTGSVVEAVRASISMPAIFTPVKLQNRFLMDGGIVNPVPVSVVKDMGATFVIACNVTRNPQNKRQLSPVKKTGLPLSIPETQIPNISGSAFSGKNVVLAALNNKINKLVAENKGKLENFQKLANTLKQKVYQGTQKIEPDTPNVFATIFQAIYAMEYEITKSKIKEADIIITPDTGQIATLEFFKGREAILEGYKAGKEKLAFRQHN